MLPAAARLLRSALLRGPPRRRFSSGPPQEPLGTPETLVAFGAMFLSCLGPAAWVLGHLEDYKKRE